MDQPTSRMFKRIVAKRAVQYFLVPAVSHYFNFTAAKDDTHNSRMYNISDKI